MSIKSRFSSRDHPQLVCFHVNGDLLPHWQAHEVTVTANPPQTVECDGEVLDPTPLTARIVPQAVRVVVPATSPMRDA